MLAFHQKQYIEQKCIKNCTIKGNLVIFDEADTQGAGDPENLIAGIKQATNKAEEVALSKVGGRVLFKHDARNYRHDVRSAAVVAN